MMFRRGSVMAVTVTAAIAMMCLFLLFLSTPSDAFVVGGVGVVKNKSPPPCQQAFSSSSSSSSLKMGGLLDFFSPQAQEARERKRRAQIEEQERLQKAIMERRKNPALMEEYKNEEN
jgi:hypothetical protein